MSFSGEKKRKVRKQAILVSNWNSLVFVSHGGIFTLRTPRLVNRKLCQKNVKQNLRFAAVNFDLHEFWYLNLLNGHMF